MDANGNTEAIASQGVQLKRGDGASEEAFTLIGEILGCPLPPMDSEEIKVTHLNSPEGFNEYILGFKESGILEIPMNFVRDDFEQMFNDYLAQDEHNYQYYIPDDSDTTFSFRGRVKAVGGEGAVVGNQIKTNVSIRITGGVSFAS